MSRQCNAGGECRVHMHICVPICRLVVRVTPVRAWPWAAADQRCGVRRQLGPPPWRAQYGLPYHTIRNGTVHAYCACNTLQTHPFCFYMHRDAPRHEDALQRTGAAPPPGEGRQVQARGLSWPESTVLRVWKSSGRNQHHPSLPVSRLQSLVLCQDEWVNAVPEAASRAPLSLRALKAGTTERVPLRVMQEEAQAAHSRSSWAPSHVRITSCSSPSIRVCPYCHDCKRRCATSWWIVLDARRPPALHLDGCPRAHGASHWSPSTTASRSDRSWHDDNNCPCRAGGRIRTRSCSGRSNSHGCTDPFSAPRGNGH